MKLYILTKVGSESSTMALAVVDDSDHIHNKVLLTNKLATKVTDPYKLGLMTIISALGQYRQVSGDPNIEVITNDNRINEIITSKIKIEENDNKNYQILYAELIKGLVLLKSDNGETNIIDRLIELMNNPDSKLTIIGE